MRIQCCSPLIQKSHHNPHSTDHHWISVVAVDCLVQAAYPQEYFYTSIVSSPLTWWYPLLRTLYGWLLETSPHPAASSLSPPSPRRRRRRRGSPSSPHEPRPRQRSGRGSKNAMSRSPAQDRDGAAQLHLATAPERGHRPQHPSTPCPALPCPAQWDCV